MQLISNGEDLHKISNPVSWEKYKKHFNMLSAEIFTQSADL